MGDKWDSTATGVDVCGNPNVVGGIFHFWGLINAGFLTKDGTVANGIDYTFDNCSQTVRALQFSLIKCLTFLATGHYLNLALRIQSHFAGDGILR